MKLPSLIVLLIAPFLLFAQAPPGMPGESDNENNIDKDEDLALIDINPVDAMLQLLTEQSPIESGCTSQKFSRADCRINMDLNCGEQELTFYFDLKDISRVFLEEADMGDAVPTLFFECAKGKNCVQSSLKQLSDQPMAPIKLPQNGGKELGEAAVKVFTDQLSICK